MTQPAAPAPQAGPEGQPIQPPAPQPLAPAAGAAPPWGDDFNPERAWTLIQKLRGESESAKSQVAQLRPIAEALGGMPSPDVSTDLKRLTDRFNTYEQQVAEERAARYRAEVAAEKGLTPAQAKRLVGTTREELLADADDYLAALPQPPTPVGNPHTPVEALRPGAMPQPPAPSLDEQIAAAQKDGRVRDVIRLQNQKLANASSQ